MVDYKSNWLGESSEDYTQEAMSNAMRDHRYDLQYQLLYFSATSIFTTTLTWIMITNVILVGSAISSYGIDTDCSGNGVYTYLPEEKLVVKH